MQNLSLWTILSYLFPANLLLISNYAQIILVSSSIMFRRVRSRVCDSQKLEKIRKLKEMIDRIGMQLEINGLDKMKKEDGLTKEQARINPFFNDL